MYFQLLAYLLGPFLLRRPANGSSISHLPFFCLRFREWSSAHGFQQLPPLYAAPCTGPALLPFPSQSQFHAYKFLPHDPWPFTAIIPGSVPLPPCILYVSYLFFHSTVVRLASLQLPTTFVPPLCLLLAVLFPGIHLVQSCPQVRLPVSDISFESRPPTIPCITRTCFTPEISN